MEANTSQTKWSIPCCSDEKCHLCKGTGLIYPERCPIHYYTGEVKTLRYLYDCWTHKNLLPFKGSPIDQPKVLFNHFERINHYVSFYSEMKNKAKQENIDFAERIMRGKNGK